MSVKITSGNYPRLWNSSAFNTALNNVMRVAAVGKLTMSCWWKPEGGIDPSDHVVRVCTGGDNDGIQFSFNADYRQTGSYRDADGYACGYGFTSGSITDQWYLSVITIVGMGTTGSPNYSVYETDATKKVLLYRAAYGGSIEGPCADRSNNDGPVFRDDTDSILLGQKTDGGNLFNNGLIAELALWTGDIGSSAITELLTKKPNAITPAAGSLLFYYPLESDVNYGTGASLTENMAWVGTPAYGSTHPSLTGGASGVTPAQRAFTYLSNLV